MKYIFISLLFLMIHDTSLSQDKPFTFKDIMQFNHINHTVISDNGDRIAYSLTKDRGDGEVVSVDQRGRDEIRIERGVRPQLSPNGNWLASFVQAPLAEILQASDKDKPKNGLALVKTSDNTRSDWDSVSDFYFSNDSNWLFIHQFPVDSLKEKNPSRENFGAPFILKNLSISEADTIQFVKTFSVDSTATWLVYSVVDTSGHENGLYAQNLKDESAETFVIHSGKYARYHGLEWHQNSRRLAFLYAKEDDKKESEPADLYVWDAGADQLNLLTSSSDAPDGWVIPSHASLTWSIDGKRLFYGYQPQFMFQLGRTSVDADEDFDLYDFDQILSEKELDVWHWDDPLVKTHEKNTWNQRRDHVYTAVYHLRDQRYVQLADQKVPHVQPQLSGNYALGRDDQQYQKLITWDGWYNDFYTVDIYTGEQNLIIDKIRGNTARISPQSQYVIIYEGGDWLLYRTADGQMHNLTERLEVSFADENNDRPQPASSYGLVGWVKDDAAVLINDRYDIWQFDTQSRNGQRITGNSRADRKQMRVIRGLHDERYFEPREQLFLSSYHDQEKYHGFYQARVGGNSISALIEDQKRFQFVAKSEKTGNWIYTRENYTEYPDLWIVDGDSFRRTRKLSDANPQISDFAWGEAELIEWNNLDGVKTQGILIYPGNYEPGKQYPVLVYYYEQYSQRLYHFNEQVINHRPSFPMYASHGYAVFLPDMHYTPGLPAYSATKSLVPGVQKLIDMGIAHPDKIGLHGHSWSGYKTAHVITQTDIFAAAVAGAPVSNMTSAYSGIRWGTGLARQFQYERAQSRIGGSLWDKRELYIENSPVFFADRINTPLLIQFGDEDGAVPWEQGIELILALRRLEKDAIMLQYRGEPHHLQKYPNKLDYTIKMKEYFDYYLKGHDPADWIIEGRPYHGK